MQKDSTILWVTEEYSLDSERLRSLRAFLELQKEMLKVRRLYTEKDYIPIITSKRKRGRHVFNFYTKTKEVISFKVFYLFFKMHSAQLLK